MKSSIMTFNYLKVVFFMHCEAILDISSSADNAVTSDAAIYVSRAHEAKQTMTRVFEDA